MIMVAHCIGPQFLQYQTQNDLSIASHLFKVKLFCQLQIKSIIYCYFVLCRILKRQSP